jgi:hypothetical protein
VAVDRESAREKLAAKLDAGAAQARAEQQQAQAAKDQAADQAAKETAEDKLRREADRASRSKPAGRSTRKDKSMVEEVITSTTFRQVARTAAREIVRGMFGTGRRR